MGGARNDKLLQSRQLPTWSKWESSGFPLNHFGSHSPPLAAWREFPTLIQKYASNLPNKRISDNHTCIYSILLNTKNLIVSKYRSGVLLCHSLRGPTIVLKCKLFTSYTYAVLFFFWGWVGRKPRIEYPGTCPRVIQRGKYGVPGCLQ